METATDDISLYEECLAYALIQDLQYLRWPDVQAQEPLQVREEVPHARD